MDIILTHEQADFDAVGSLLGAYLLNPHAIPVLPRKSNRNVRSFLTIYGPKLPFVDANDLDGEPIEHVMLVDTQSLVTIKGMSADTNITVLDHHPLRDSLPDDWRLSIDEIGSCTTLLVEQIREQDIRMDMFHATLLLLGIYEDTGSLAYESTTARDLIAAAYLLEQGASLRIVNEYLNPPLSAEQRVLYEKLLDEAEIYNIQGQKIIITTAHAEEMAEEISSIAHKLRDILDLDALFLLVSTQQGIRMVARSVTDYVDVSKVAAHFGGGGHDRASSALIRQRDVDAMDVKEPLQNVKAELLMQLMDVVSPSLQVEQIMSGEPLLISPEMTARQVVKVMQQYGYEGYPVVQNDKVIGLLTRRAVDRALSHKMGGLTAVDLMDAGEIAVTPQDSVDRLQRVMSRSGWGQVPVVNGDGQVIGIVTRTDLIKARMESEERVRERRNLAAQMEVSLPDSYLAVMRAVSTAATADHYKVYVVGGFVRDLILGTPSLDLDMVVEGNAIHLAHHLANEYGGRVVTHRQFGTAKWILEEAGGNLKEAFKENGTPFEAYEFPDSLDLITARTEFYEYPTALPTVKQSSINLDLFRRDFTINTMAVRLDHPYYGDMYDYWGGLNDLHKGLIRVLHSLSFVDDPTRLMRAVRFEQRFGFQIETRTEGLMRGAYHLLSRVSGDRIRHELNLILAEQAPVLVLRRMKELGLLSAIHPALDWHDEVTQPMEIAIHGPIPDEWHLEGQHGNLNLRQLLGYEIWFSRFSPEDAAKITHDLRFSAVHQRQIAQVASQWPGVNRLRDAKPSEVAEALDLLTIEDVYALYCLAHEDEALQEILEHYAWRWRKIRAHVKGEDLRGRGLIPGPIYKEILTRLRAAWLDGEISSVEEEYALLDRFLEELKGRSGNVGSV
ncbi:MAG: CBS domain-containing protein [Anaerolineaceae bacterium]|nr:CBS domain-containing protein [Anaerolineaceae bacterium]